MLRETLDALRACLVTFAVCAVAYPAAVFGIGHTLFPRQAEGSLIERDGKVVGSELIGQPFGSDRYFQPRPSAAGSSGYAADAASGSNLGTKNPALRDRIMVDVAKQVIAHDNDADLKAKLDRLDALQSDLKAKNEIKEKTPADTEAIARLEEGVSTAKSELTGALAARAKAVKAPVPADLVTASGGGLDPDISPESADYQAERVASARGGDPAKVRDLIARHTEQSGRAIGAPGRVNVLLLNLDLDKELPPRAAGAAAPATPEATAPARVEVPAPKPEVVAPAPAQATSDPLAVLASRVDKLQERLDAAPIDELAAELKGVKAQVARLADIPGDSARASRRLAELDGRVEALGREVGEARAQVRAAGNPTQDRDKVAALEAQVRSLRDDLAKLREPASKPEPAVAAVAKPAPPDLSPARKLFRERQYAAASDAFRALTASHPDDARAWYYAALSRGFATGQWRGETEDLVNKGLDRERAGSTTAAEIDAAFADLPPGSGREWLGFYRQRASAKP